MKVFKCWAMSLPSSKDLSSIKYSTFFVVWTAPIMSFPTAFSKNFSEKSIAANWVILINTWKRLSFSGTNSKEIVTHLMNFIPSRGKILSSLTLFFSVSILQESTGKALSMSFRSKYANCIQKETKMNFTCICLTTDKFSSSSSDIESGT